MALFKDGSLMDTFAELFSVTEVFGKVFGRKPESSNSTQPKKSQNYFFGFTDKEEQELESTLEELENVLLVEEGEPNSVEYKDKFTDKYLKVTDVFEKIMSWALERDESSFWQNREASFIKNSFLVFIAKRNGVNSTPDIERTETFEVKDDNAKGGFRKVTLKSPAPQQARRGGDSPAKKFILRLTRSAQKHRNSLPKGRNKAEDKAYWDQAIRLTQQEYKHVPLRKVGDADFEGWVAKVTNFADDSLETGAREYISERRRHRDTDGWFTKFMRSLQVK